MSSRSLLVVEEDPELRDVFVAVLEEEGYPVRAVADRAQALASLDEECPALILFDLPSRADHEILDGVQVLIEAGVPVPVLVLAEDPWVLQQARKLGADGWLRKPFQLEALLDLIDLHCGPSARLEVESAGHDAGSLPLPR